MNRLEFSKAIQQLHAPAERQKKLADAVGLKHGVNSKQYADEFAKYSKLLLSITPKEHEIWCQFCIFLFTESIQNGKPKEKVLADIIETGKHMEESKKPEWRNVYKSISAL
jgi:hypothetical protein